MKGRKALVQRRNVAVLSGADFLSWAKEALIALRYTSLALEGSALPVSDAVRIGLRSLARTLVFCRSRVYSTPGALDDEFCVPDGLIDMLAVFRELPSPSDVERIAVDEDYFFWCSRVVSEHVVFFGL